MLTPHPLLVPLSRKSRAIPLLPLRTVRPVQNLSACTQGCAYLYLLKEEWIGDSENKLGNVCQT